MNRTMLALLLAPALAMPAPPATAQEARAPAQAQPSPEEIRLRREVADLRDQLARAEERIRRLEEERTLLLGELRQLREQRVGRAGGDAADEPRPTREPRAEVPQDPYAAPAALLRALRERYEQEFASVPHDTQPAIEAYRRDVQKWIEQVRREMRSRTTWLVRFGDLRQEGRDRLVTAQVIDEQSGLPIGEPFTTSIDSSTAMKLERGMERFDRWKATVILAADPKFNPERADPGVFEHPPFVGRYVDFGISIDWRYVNGERTREEAEAATGERPGRSPQPPQRESRDR